jgi:hypothetical protein
VVPTKVSNSPSLVSNVVVYPNPVDKGGIVNVDCENYSDVTVLTLDGKPLFNTFKKSFSVSDFDGQTGYYLLEIANKEGHKKTEKLLVE